MFLTSSVREGFNPLESQLQEGRIFLFLTTLPGKLHQQKIISVFSTSLVKIARDQFFCSTDLRRSWLTPTCNRKRRQQYKYCHGREIKNSVEDLQSLFFYTGRYRENWEEYLQCKQRVQCAWCWGQLHPHVLHASDEDKPNPEKNKRKCGLSGNSRINSFAEVKRSWEFTSVFT